MEKTLLYQKNAHGITLKKLLKQNDVNVKAIKISESKHGLVYNLPILIGGDKIYNFAEAVTGIEAGEIK